MISHAQPSQYQSPVIQARETFDDLESRYTSLRGRKTTPKAVQVKRELFFSPQVIVHTVSLSHEEVAVSCVHPSTHPSILLPLICMFLYLSVHLVTVLECMSCLMHCALESKGWIRSLHLTADQEKKKKIYIYIYIYTT